MVRMRENTFAGNVGAAIVEAVLTCRFSHWDKGRIQLERVQGPGWERDSPCTERSIYIYRNNGSF